VPSEIAVVIITKNEERVIEGCLARLKDWAAEIIVVDSLSTDRTAQICEANGARVIARPWPGSFADQKNFAIRQAKAPWVLILDADELVDENLQRELLKATREHDENPALVGFQIPTRNYFINGYSDHAWAPDYHVRLIRNHRGIAYDTSSVVHEKLKCDGVALHNVRPNGELTKRLDNPILHYSNTSFSQIFAKHNMYTTLEVEKLARSGQGGNLALRIFRPGLCFFYYYFVKRGFRDGVNGFMIALLMFNYELAVYLKLWEARVTRDRTQSLPESKVAGIPSPSSPPT